MVAAQANHLLLGRHPVYHHDGHVVLVVDAAELLELPVGHRLEHVEEPVDDRLVAKVVEHVAEHLLVRGPDGSDQ